MLGPESTPDFDSGLLVLRAQDSSCEDKAQGSGSGRGEENSSLPRPAPPHTHTKGTNPFIPEAWVPWRWGLGPSSCPAGPALRSLLLPREHRLPQKRNWQGKSWVTSFPVLPQMPPKLCLSHKAPPLSPWRKGTSPPTAALKPHCTQQVLPGISFAYGLHMLSDFSKYQGTTPLPQSITSQHSQALQTFTDFYLSSPRRASAVNQSSSKLPEKDGLAPSPAAQLLPRQTMQPSLETPHISLQK